ncbi:class I SAM-dependent methyltransferase [Pseudonocardia eucalypti]|uniref:Class I SAM-dependent methyltransferase n=1 Tax=Pseudonocardia eucalypti TaxID=648755 RepID=A0ABP9QRT1_9PSEU|nr:SAM-dependent methyltransferase [Pseudonocardia eucalypti]
MDVTPALDMFNEAYENGSPPWVIGEPQPVVVELEEAGQFNGTILDAGCGTGEHTIYLARLGYDVIGVDGAPAAVRQARAAAVARGVDARFEEGDALELPADGRYDTVLDTGLFHIFDDTDRARYVRSLHGALRPGGVLHLIALSDTEPGFGPRIGEHVIRDAFTTGWTLEELRLSHFRGTVPDNEDRGVELKPGTVVNVAAWLTRLRRP